MKWLLLPLITLTALAGCLAEDPADDAEDEEPGTCAPTAFEGPDIRFLETTDDPIALVEDRATAWDFETYNVRTCSLHAVGWTPLRWTDGGEPDPHGYIGEIDMRGDLDIGAVAVLGNGEMPAVYLLDISERSAPEVIHRIDQSGTYVTDVKISDTGDYLYTASQTTPGPGETYGLTDLEPAGPTGFTVYDIRDPAAPVNLGTFADAQVGCHMLSNQRIGATEVVACVSQQVRLWALEEVQPGRLVPLGFVDYVPSEGPMGAPLPSGPIVGDPTGELSSGPHDMTIQEDPETGQILMTVSHWDAGVRVVDLTDAPAATELGSWDGEGATHYSGNVHTAMVVHTAQGRFVVATPEYTSDGTVPGIWVLDATDFSDMELVAQWYHPGEHESQGLYLTTHQWQAAPTGPEVDASDVNIYLTYNHAGVWVLDFGRILEGDNLGAIEGFHLSRSPLDQDTATTGNAILSTWDVNVVDGYIYGSDRATGLWVFHNKADPKGDPAYMGFA